MSIIYLKDYKIKKEINKANKKVPACDEYFGINHSNVSMEDIAENLILNNYDAPSSHTKSVKELDEIISKNSLIGTDYFTEEVEVKPKKKFLFQIAYNKFKGFFKKIEEKPIYEMKKTLCDYSRTFLNFNKYHYDGINVNKNVGNSNVKVNFKPKGIYVKKYSKGNRRDIKKEIILEVKETKSINGRISESETYSYIDTILNSGHTQRKIHMKNKSKLNARLNNYRRNKEMSNRHGIVRKLMGKICEGEKNIMVYENEKYVSKNTKKIFNSFYFENSKININNQFDTHGVADYEYSKPINY
jgi:hypothetical protein